VRQRAWPIPSPHRRLTPAIGFAVGTYHVNIAVAAIIIGAVSATMSLIGLELGDRLGAKTGERGELFGGLVFIGVGIALAIGVT
jgi:manganese efflux pump family protein